MQNKINIVQFVPYFPPHRWGLETHAEEWANAWTSAGFWNVTTLSSSIGQEGERASEYQKIIPMESIEFVPHFPFPKFWKKSFWEILRNIKHEKPDIVVTRTRFFFSSFLGWVCAKFWGIPWVHIEHGSWAVETDRLLIKIFSRLFDATLGFWIMRSSNAVIGISEACRWFIQSFWRKDTIPVIFRGVDFIPGVRIEQNLNAWTRPIRITFVGRLTYLKWAHILIEALSHINDNVSWHATIVWDGEERARLQEQVKNLGLSDKITLTGMKDREYIGKEILPQTDIFVNPSFQEWLPTTVLEALLAKCRVIATDVWGTKEISQEDDLTIISHDDVNMLIRALEEAFIDYEEKMWKSYDHIREYFDWKKSIIRYHSAIENTLEGKK